MIEISDVSHDLAQARRLHAFLLPHFGPEELEPLDVFEAPIREGGPVESILLLGEEDGAVVCGAIAELLQIRNASGEPLGDRVLGATGHALVDPSMRGRGVGRMIAQASEAAMFRYAAQYGLTLEALILESESDARRFWSRMGYRWPQGLRYWQPPLGYDPDGAPNLPSVPLFLMIRHPAHPDTIPGPLLRDYARSVYYDWYRDELPDQLPDPAACQRATRWMDQVLIAPSMATIVDDSIPLVDLRNLSEADSAAWLQGPPDAG
ncbi:MAG: GNAT family N-acetyltransferase [Myxococcota bacterium]